MDDRVPTAEPCSQDSEADSPASILRAQGPIAVARPAVAGDCSKGLLRTMGEGAGAMTGCAGVGVVSFCPWLKVAELACWEAGPCTAGRVRRRVLRAPNPLPCRQRMERRAKADRVRSRASSLTSSTAGSQMGCWQEERPDGEQSAGAGGQV